MRRALLFWVLLLLPAGLAGQQTDASRRAQLEARRDSLEREVVQKFVERLGRDLAMSDEQGARTTAILLESGTLRRALMRESSALRSRLHRAARASDMTDAEYTRLLAEHETLRTREHDLWRREQHELSRVLTPKQRVQFIIAWAHFQDDMREIISRRMREQGDRDGDRRDRGSDPRSEKGSKPESRHDVERATRRDTTVSRTPGLESDSVRSVEPRLVADSAAPAVVQLQPDSIFRR